MEDWAKGHGLAMASWPREPLDPFFNINTPEDLSTATVMLSRMPGTSKSASKGEDKTQENCDG